MGLLCSCCGEGTPPLLLSSWGGSLFQDFYDEQGVFAENFWPQSEPAQALAFNPRGRVSKALTPPPTTQSINNQVSDWAEAELDSRPELHLRL